MYTVHYLLLLLYVVPIWALSSSGSSGSKVRVLLTGKCGVQYVRVLYSQLTVSCQWQDTVSIHTYTPLCTTVSSTRTHAYICLCRRRSICKWKSFPYMTPLGCLWTVSVYICRSKSKRENALSVLGTIPHELTLMRHFMCYKWRSPFSF